MTTSLPLPTSPMPGMTRVGRVASATKTPSSDDVEDEVDEEEVID